MRNRVLATLLAVVFAFSCLPAAVFAQEPVALPTIKLDTVSGRPGEVVEVNVRIENNPGVSSAGFQVFWDAGLEMSGKADETNSVFSTMDYTPPANTNNGCKFMWDVQDMSQCARDDGVVLKLRFKIPEKDNEPRYNIWIECDPYYNADSEGKDVEYKLIPGAIVTSLPGDVNENSRVDSRDVTMIRQYISDGRRTDPNGYNVTLNELAADVDDNGRLDSRDVTMIRQYISDGRVTNPNGYNVTLLPSSRTCLHIHSECIPSKKPTCTEDGNIEHWKCIKCGRLFADRRCTAELSPQAVVHKAIGHTEVIDPYVAPQPGVEGWTEGSHCSVCGQVIRPQEKIPALKAEEYAIEYHISDNDPYLQGIEQQNKLVNPNPATYTAGKTLRLLNMNNPEGYRFKGWFDGSGENAVQIKTIENQTGMIQLYAHWERVPYTLEFDSPDVPVDSLQYTVDKGVVLPKVSHFGYTFVGWSIDGEIVTEIKPGTVPPVGSNKIVVHANWTSDRNQAVPAKELGKPVIIEDVDEGRYLFLYEIGEIRNVPLHVNHNWGKRDNLDVMETIEVSDTVTDSLSVSAAEAVANATTKSSAWTLSEDWNQSSSAATEAGEKHGRTEGKTTENGQVTGQKYYVGNNTSGTTSVSSSSGGNASVSAKVTQQTSTGLNGSYSHDWGNTSDQERKHSVDVGIHGSIGTKPGKLKPGWNVEGGVDYNYTNDKKDSSYDKNSLNIAASRNTFNESIGAASGEAHWDCSQNDTSSWNSSSGYEASRQESQVDTVSDTISDVIFEKYQISSTVDHNLGNSETKTTSGTSTQEKEYTSAVEHSTEQCVTHTVTDHYTGDVAGYYRHVTTGTVHVFAVVGFDAATRSYFTYTYNVLGHDRNPYLDYSKSDPNFRDCENGILPFEVPYEVHEYVSSALAGSEGLKVNAQGIVTEYTGNDDYVTIPEYISSNNQDGTYSAVKVVGIEENVFKGKNISGVAFPKYVSEIPAHAFEGCTSLKEVICKGVSTIGEYAFSGCTALGSTSKSGGFIVDKFVTTLGKHAFDGVNNVKIDAVNAAVADSATVCGAKNLTLRLVEMSEPYDNREIVLDAKATGTETFRIWDNGTPRTNLRVNSNAAHTEINNMKFVGNSQIPLKIDSEKLSLNRTTVDQAPGLTMVLLADHTAIDLYSDVVLSSAGNSAVLGKKMTLSQTDSTMQGKMKVTGDVLVTDPAIEDASLLEITGGEVVQINNSDFENYLNSHKMSFDAAGGSVSPDSKTVTYSAPYGELPVPTREGYDFQGWYTAAEGGEKVTDQTVCKSSVDFTVYAHWSSQTFKISWEEAPDYKVEVNRTASPQAGAATGRVNNGAAIYYGDVLEIRYVPNAGYVISETGITSATVTGELTAREIYAVTGNQGYKVSWNSGTGYGITVERTSSPRGAATGRLDSGAAVYYGDVLRVSYQAHTGYSLTGRGEENITVTGNVDGSRIYASAKPNQYTYRILYRSVNGTDLGNDTITRDFGTVNDVGAPGVSGYNTPGVQHVAWDVAGSKDIVFHYEPQAVSTPHQIKEFSHYVPGDFPKIDYSADYEYRNRTADAVEIRAIVSMTIYDGYSYMGHAYEGNINGVSTGEVRINTYGNPWKDYAPGTRTDTVHTPWIRVHVGTTNATNVVMNEHVYVINANGTLVNWDGYSELRHAWQINIPAF